MCKKKGKEFKTNNNEKEIKMRDTEKKI